MWINIPILVTYTLLRPRRENRECIFGREVKVTMQNGDSSISLKSNLIGNFILSSSHSKMSSLVIVVAAVELFILELIEVPLLSYAEEAIPEKQS